jgi:type IV secretion system protein VirD4
MFEQQRNGERANLEKVSASLTEPDVYEQVAGPDGTKELQLVRGLTMTARLAVETGGYEIASLLGRFAGRTTNEIASIRSTADTQTRWIISKFMREDLKKPGVDFARLKEVPTSVFIVLPSTEMRAKSSWLRMLVVSALRALYRAAYGQSFSSMRCRSSVTWRHSPTPTLS